MFDVQAPNEIPKKLILARAVIVVAWVSEKRAQFRLPNAHIG
jgi:hypothetical protein